ncbi:UNVERIFIED_ORG: transcriptional regulator GlxA family with amidase domain [Pseudomonas reinekei]
MKNSSFSHANAVGARWRTEAGVADERLLETILKLLDEPERQPIALAEVAQALLLSPRTLRRRLLELNTRFSTLMAEARRMHVCRYLTETSWPLDQIAEHVGYSDAANLRQAVKRLTGESPQDLRSRTRVN